MAIDIRRSAHTLSPEPVWEVLVDGAVAGVMYATGDKSFKILSAHFSNVQYILDPGSSPKVPEIRVEFDPRPYRIDSAGRIVKY